MNRALQTALISLVTNIAYSAYYLVFAVLSGSWWMLTLGSYYLILSLVRFVVLQTKGKERFIVKFTGVMLIILSIPLVGTVVLSVIQERGQEFHMVLMIAMAAYAFTKITLATVNLIKSRRSSSATLITLRNIAFADAFVSIFALQRSMLVSFEGMSEAEIVIMNFALGSAVCVVVFLLGINLIRSKNILFSQLNNI